MSEPIKMELVVGADGVARCIDDEAPDLRALGKLQITRASHVDPDAEGHWWADMGPVDGPVLGPYGSRTEALKAEREWLVHYRTPGFLLRLWPRLWGAGHHPQDLDRQP